MKIRYSKDALLNYVWRRARWSVNINCEWMRIW